MNLLVACPPSPLSGNFPTFSRFRFRLRPLSTFQLRILELVNYLPYKASDGEALLESRVEVLSPAAQSLEEEQQGCHQLCVINICAECRQYLSLKTEMWKDISPEERVREVVR